MIKVHPLFFSPVYQVTVPNGLLALDAVKEYEYSPTYSEGSHNSHMTKNTSILNDFPKEKEIILNYFYEIKNKYLRHESTKFVMTTSWATKVEKNSVCQYHTHSNNFFSGVLYFDEYWPDSAPLEFENPLLGNQSFMFSATEYNSHNARDCKFQLPKNTIVFFPSYLRHRIGYHASDKPRYSIAFNFHPVGEYGIGDSKINTSVLK
jgi:uncharacterized protein (TIGR02466 family)